MFLGPLVLVIRSFSFSHSSFFNYILFVLFFIIFIPLSYEYFPVIVVVVLFIINIIFRPNTHHQFICMCCSYFVSISFFSPSIFTISFTCIYLFDFSSQYRSNDECELWTTICSRVSSRFVLPLVYNHINIDNAIATFVTQLLLHTLNVEVECDWVRFAII